MEKFILLVEDNPDDEALTLRALKKSAVNSPVRVVHDGVEALDFLFARGNYSDRNPDEIPHIVILDLQMPKIDGLGVLREIRANERTKLVPVVIFSSTREDKDIRMGYKLGANSFIRKAVDFNKYQEAIGGLSHYWLDLNEYPPRIDH